MLCRGLFPLCFSGGQYRFGVAGGVCEVVEPVCECPGLDWG